MCSGRVDISFVLKSFFNANDGVYIGACKLDECNYTTHGNYHALKMVILCKRILEYVGLNPERLRLEFMSAAEGNKFAETVESFTNKIKQIGAFAKSEGLDVREVKDKIEKIMALVPYIKIATREKLLAPVSKNPNDWENIFTLDEVKELLENVPSYYIDPDKCQACGTCFRRCPEDAVIGGKNLIHIINQDKCIKCGTCYEACPPKFGAIMKITGEPVPEPVPEEKRAIDRKKKNK
jgi:coenzyme F420-reducing hydrogenase delta subunit/NAD-dependent dihydropyrimidine dehydrogenase PreA subunit